MLSLSKTLIHKVVSKYIAEYHAHGSSILKFKSQSVLVFVAGITGLSRKEKKKYEDWKAQSLGGKVGLKYNECPRFLIIQHRSNIHLIVFPFRMLAMLTIKKRVSWLVFYFYACMWFSSYSYGALLGSISGRWNSAINGYWWI